MASSKRPYRGHPVQKPIWEPTSKETGPSHMDMGRGRLGLKLGQKLPGNLRTKDVMEAGAPFGSKREFIRNYDGPMPVRLRIEELRKQGLSEEQIYDKLVAECRLKL